MQRNMDLIKDKLICRGAMLDAITMVLTKPKTMVIIRAVRRLERMKDKTNTLEQAIASVEMEGFNFTQKDKDICKALASGEISLSKFIEDCKAGKFRSYVGG